MKAIERRVSKLEAAAAPAKYSDSLGAILRARRERRLEAEGKPPEKRLEIDFTGCRTIADHLRRARAARLAALAGEEVSSDNEY
jgi:hypothetical protein